MLFLALRNLRVRTGRTLFTAFAIALGVALILAARMAGLAADEVNRQARADRVAGADLEVTNATRTNFSVHLMDTLAARPEVESVAPLLRARAKNVDLALLGVDPVQPLRPYHLAAGAFFAAPDSNEILIPLGWATFNGLGVGNTVSLALGAETHDYTVIGLLKEESLPGSLPTAWLPIHTLQAALSAPNEVAAILVKLSPNTSSAHSRETLQTAIGSNYVVTSAEAGATAQNAFATLGNAALPFASVVVLLAGAFFIYNAFAITLAERRREIGQLRALGMTRGQVWQLTLTEALLVVLIGSVLGLPLGWGLGWAMAAGAAAATGGAPLDGIILAVGIGLIVTVGVVFNIARQAGRVSPLMAWSAEVGASPDERRSRWEGAGVLLWLIIFVIAQGALLAYFRDPPTATLSFWVFLPPLFLGGAVLSALPLMARAMLRAGERLSARWSVTARLALGALARQPGRTALTTLTLAIGLMLVVFIAGISEGVITLFADNFRPVFGAYDFALYRATASDEVAPPVPPALQAEIDTLAADAEVVSYGSIPVPDPEGGLFGLTAPSPVYIADLSFFNRAPIFRAAEGSWAEAERYFAAGPALAIPEIAARRFNLHPGDAVMLDTYEGKVSFTVAVVSHAFILTPDNGARYFHAYPVMWLLRVRPDADRAALQERLSAIARAHQIQFQDDLGNFFGSFLTTFFGSLFALFGGLTSISGIVAGLGIANTLFASTLERQRELGVLRALGLTRGQVRGMVVIEAGLLGVMGTVSGVLGGLAMSLAAVQLFMAQLALTGFIPPDRAPLPWGMVAFALAAGPLLAMLAALWPADRAASVNPADAMRAEGATGFLPPAKHLGPTGLRGLVARLPLAAKLSFTTSLVIILTIAALTAIRVNDERQLLEDNIRAIFARGLELMVDSTESQLPVAVTELTPALAASLVQQSGAQADSLNQLFQGGDSPYDFSLRYALITDNDYHVISSSRAEYNNTTLTDTLTLVGSTSDVRLTDWTGERAFEAVAAVKNQGGRQLGYMIVGLSTEPVDNITRDIVRGSAAMMTAALAAAILLTIFLTRRALIPISQMVDASRAVARGDLARRAPETRWDDVGQLARAFNEMMLGLNDRERMRDLFGRYLSREVSEAARAGRVSLGGERKTVTCLYVDMRGSTAFAEKYQPEEVMSALNEYFEVIILAAEAHGGIVNRFVGDEAVCVFGALAEYRDHADRAMQAALAMRTGLAYLNHKREALGLPTLKFGMGLNSGEVVAGATGSEERQEYTVIGDVMNVGARIQALNKEFPDSDILFSEFTLGALGPKAAEYVLADLGPMDIRGKTLPVRVFGLEGKQPST